MLRDNGGSVGQRGAWCHRSAVMLFHSRAQNAAHIGRWGVKRSPIRQFDAALIAWTPQANIVVGAELLPSAGRALGLAAHLHHAFHTVGA